jgi:HAD superfamily hydrolase (TIGR01509 family)
MSAGPAGTDRAMTDRTACVDTVLLDIDGTLLDSVYHHTVAWVRAFAAHGHPVPARVVHRHVGMGGDKLVPAVAGEEVERSLGDDVRASWEKEYDAMLEEPALLPGALELLDELRSRGLTVVLASSSIPRHARRAMDLLDAERRSDAAATAEDAEESKPDPELLDTVMARVDARSSVLVGDSVWDVEAARRAGIPTIALLSGGYGEDELRSAGAAWVFEDPQALLHDLDRVLAPH